MTPPKKAPLPAFLIIQSRNDPLVDVEQAEDFYTHMIEVGGCRVELNLDILGTHFEILKSEDFFRAVSAFSWSFNDARIENVAVIEEVVEVDAGVGEEVVMEGVVASEEGRIGTGHGDPFGQAPLAEGGAEEPESDFGWGMGLNINGNGYSAENVNE
jgi:hypothetical protein